MITKTNYIYPKPFVYKVYIELFEPTVYIIQTGRVGDSGEVH